MNKVVNDEVDVAIIGAGIGGLSAAAILSEKYNLNVGVYESHYRLGGVAHSFPIKSKDSKCNYLFDAGPTIVSGCTQRPYNPLQQVLISLGAENEIKWIPYGGWGMNDETGNWLFKLGSNQFDHPINGPLAKFGGSNAINEFKALREACAPLCSGAAGIPTMALRGDKFKLLPLLGYLDALQAVIPYSTTLEGSFQSLMDEHVQDPWLRSWLDALAFSLSALPASETGAAAMAYTLYDLHREGACLDYPLGGMGEIAEAFSKVIVATGSSVHLSTSVDEITIDPSTSRANGVLLSSGKYVKAKKAVICNANAWALPHLLRSSRRQGFLSDDANAFLDRCDYNYDQEKRKTKPERIAEEESAGRKLIPTKSFMHLHLGLNIEGLDLSQQQPHYTVMHKGLFNIPTTTTKSTMTSSTSTTRADPCGDRNMVAVSNPCVLDSSMSLTSDSKYHVVHAYGAANDDYEPWSQHPSSSSQSSSTDEGVSGYKTRKDDQAKFLYESIARALQIDEKEVRERCDVALVGSPYTHARFNNRFRGSYGPTFRSTLDGPVTPIQGLFCCGDSTFPGIGVPAVCVSGASAANTIVNPLTHILKAVL